MPFSHHSHSGQFCPGHAKNSLEEMVQTAINKGMKTYALTEHMPRELQDFYPEELEMKSTEEFLQELIGEFHAEAHRLQKLYRDRIEILVGFESEWIRPSSLQLIKDLHGKYNFDYVVGSVHHVHTHPIDFDRPMYEKAREVAGGTDERLFEDYYDSQFEMLQALKPVVVGHFDLIRLLSDDPNASWTRFEGVWSRIQRNLEFIASYSGILELNSSGLRKGMTEPYPKAEICQAFLALNGGFCLSDDAHSIEQVGTNYDKLLIFMQRAGIDVVNYLSKSSNASIATCSVSLAKVKRLLSYSA